MGRRSKGAEARSLLRKIRIFLPNVSLRSSLIVGFPGEKENQFNALLDFVKEVRFDHLGAFMFSPEEGTPASKLSHPVPERIKKERLRILMDIQKAISLKKYEAMVGQKKVVLVEGSQRAQGVLRGRLQTQAPEIDGSVFLYGNAKTGDWVEARITQALPYDLVAKIERVLP
jgi:ribosomal protein S12 methylthiotransferase